MRRSERNAEEGPEGVSIKEEKKKLRKRKRRGLPTKRRRERGRETKKITGETGIAKNDRENHQKIISVEK